MVTFGMNRVWCDGVQSAGTPGVVTVFVAGSMTGSVVHGTALGVGSWVRTGCPDAAMAAGFVEVWSTIRLLMTRGWSSKTLPVFCL